MKHVLLFVILLLGYVWGTEDDDNYVLYREAVKFVNICGMGELSSCLKERALKYVESLPGNLDLGGGFKIRQNSIDDAARTFRGKSIVLPGEARARESALNDALTERILDYARSHTLEFRLPLYAFKSTKQEIEEGRKGKGGDKKEFLYLLFFKAALLGALALNVSFKALLISKIALVIAGIMSLKKLFEQQHTSYEVVAHGHDDYGHGHYIRPYAHEVAYKDSIVRSN